MYCILCMLLAVILLLQNMKMYLNIYITICRKKPRLYSFTMYIHLEHHLYDEKYTVNSLDKYKLNKCYTHFSFYITLKLIKIEVYREHSFVCLFLHAAYMLKLYEPILLKF